MVSVAFFGRVLSVPGRAKLIPPVEASPKLILSIGHDSAEAVGDPLLDAQCNVPGDCLGNEVGVENWSLARVLLRARRNCRTAH